MIISKKLLIVTLAFSVLGSIGSQPLVAMKRTADGYPEGEREPKRRREDVGEIQIDQIDQEPTREDFLNAIKSKNLDLIGNIIEQKPEWMTSGPLKYLTKHNAEELVDWLHGWTGGGVVLSQLIFGEVTDLKQVKKMIRYACACDCRYNRAIVKSLCTDSRLSGEIVQAILSWSTNHCSTMEAFHILLNDQSVNPEALTEAFEFDSIWGCTPLHDAIDKGNVEAVKLLMSNKYITADGINHALKQLAAGGSEEDRINYGLSHPEREIDKMFQILFNDSKVTAQGVNDALVACNDFEILEKILKDHRANADSVNQVLRKGTTEFLPINIVNFLIADKRINPETIDQALLDSSSAEYGELKINYEPFSFHEKEKKTNFHRKQKLLALLNDNRVTVQGINIALVYAATQGNKMAFDVLRADPRLKNTSPFPLEDLMTQCPYAFREVASYLGVNPAAMQKDINQAFFDAVTLGHCDAVALLLSCPGIGSDSVEKALMIAVNNNNLDMIKTLHESMNLTTEGIHAAMQASLEKGYVRAFNFLRNDARTTVYPKEPCSICYGDYDQNTMYILLPCCSQLICLDCCQQSIAQGYQCVIQGFGNYGEEYHRCPFCRKDINDAEYAKIVGDAQKSAK